MWCDPKNKNRSASFFSVARINYVFLVLVYFYALFGHKTSDGKCYLVCKVTIDKSSPCLSYGVWVA